MDRKRTRVWFDVSLSLLSKNPAKRPKPKMPVQRRSSKNRDTKAANKYHKYVINNNVLFADNAIDQEKGQT